MPTAKRDAPWTETAIEETILSLLEARDPGKTICPSEVARALMPTGWKEGMEPVRQTANRLVAASRIDITQKGRVVDGRTAKGPIRLRLRRN